jgi:hypothetical protein
LDNKSFLLTAVDMSDFMDMPDAEEQPIGGEFEEQYEEQQQEQEQYEEPEQEQQQEQYEEQEQQQEEEAPQVFSMPEPETEDALR